MRFSLRCALRSEFFEGLTERWIARDGPGFCAWLAQADSDTVLSQLKFLARRLPDAVLAWMTRQSDDEKGFALIAVNEMHATDPADAVQQISAERERLITYALHDPKESFHAQLRAALGR